MIFLFFESFIRVYNVCWLYPPTQPLATFSLCLPPPIASSFYFIKVLTDIADSSGILLSQDLLFNHNHYF